MKKLIHKKPFLDLKKENQKKLLIGFGLVMFLNFGAVAQNSSYNGNSSPIPLPPGTGIQNSAFGGGALGSLTNGNNNSAFGYFSMAGTTLGMDNVAFGRFSLYSGSGGGRPVSFSQNAAIGAESMYSNVSGSQNSATGFRSLYQNTNGSFNVADGAYALNNNSSGAKNVGIGFQSMFINSIGSGNVGVGYMALRTNASGNNNVAVGQEALYNSTTSSGIVAVGFQSLYNNVIGSNNVGIGPAALYSNQTGKNNTAMGQSALYNNTVDGNVAIGSYALYHNTKGVENTAMGTEALSSNLEGNYNSAFGYRALYNNNSSNVTSSNLVNGICNSAFGNKALFNNINGRENCAMGVQALYNNVGYTAVNPNGPSKGDQNTAFGNWSLFYNNGSSNTAIGWDALYANLTGDRNTAVGLVALAGQQLTGSDNTALGAYADGNSATLNNAMALGAGALVNTSNKTRIGNGTMGITECQMGVYTVSDGRFKTKISETDVKGLEFIKLLRPVVYNFDTKQFTEFLTKNMPDSLRKNYLNKDFANSTAVRQTGFIAQEVEKAAKQVGYDFSGLHKPESDIDNYSIAYDHFVVPLVKAVQQQQDTIEKQKADNLQQIQDLQKQIDDLKQLLATQGKTGTATGVDSNNPGSAGFSMAQNEPNPFTGETIVKYTLPQSYTSAYMAVYDLSGKQITTLAITQKGSSSITITSEKLAAGIYIYSIVADGKVMDSKRMVVADK